ncbi:MAG: nucleotidyltransferase domain-containing protein [Planctomycetota bacterium]
MRTLEKAKAIKTSHKQLLLNLKAAVQKLVPSADLFLYGSRARGTAEPESDFDILILTDEALSTEEEDRIRDAIYELELSLEVVISTVFYAKVEWATPVARAMPFHQRVEKESIRL